MSIYHVWNGTILTITSDSGTSSMDLKGGEGDTGCRGPQGPPGVVLDEQGNVIVDLSNYYTREEVDLALENVEPQEIDLSNYATVDYVGQTVNNQFDVIENTLTDYYTKLETDTAITNATSGLATTSYVDSQIDGIEIPTTDLTGYATETYVTTEIAKAQLEGAGVDTSGFATKDDLADYKVNVDDLSIKINDNGVLSTTIGGGFKGYAAQIPVNKTLEILNGKVAPDFDFHFEGGETYCLEFKYSDGVVDTVIGKFPSPVAAAVSDNFIVEDSDITYLRPPSKGAPIFGTKGKNKTYYLIIVLEFNSNIDTSLIYLDELCVSLGNKSTGTLEFIKAQYIPVDGVTTTIENGKLVALAGGTIDGLSNYYTKAEIDAMFANSSSLPSGEEVEY